MEEPRTVNPLLSTSKHSDSQLQVQLHPLVILTISDYITRHVLREGEGPVVGAILGTQHGRDITMEVAFECRLQPDGSEAGGAKLDAEWFDKRLQQFKDVHKSSALDLVGWFTIGTSAGPKPYLLPIHRHLIELYNDSALLVLFEPTAITDGSARGGKLPISIYETVHGSATDTGDGQTHPPGEGPIPFFRFQQIPYSVETGEAEMIGVDSISSGAGNAALQPDDAKTKQQQSAVPNEKKDRKGKGKAAGSAIAEIVANGPSADVTLSPEDESRIQALTAKANATRMLQQRIRLIKSYLASIPPCYLNQPPPSDPTAIQPMPDDLELPHVILRQTASLLARLPLLAGTPARDAESLAQASDVAMTSLLSAMGATVSAAQRMGHKAHVFETARAARQMRGLDYDGADEDHVAALRASLGDGFGMNGGPGGGGGKRPRAHDDDEALDLNDDRWNEMDED